MMSELGDDEQWRQRFRRKLGINDIEVRLDALERRQLGLNIPRRKDWWDWLEQQPTWIQALAFVVVPLVFMTLGALWFLLMYVLAKWLFH